jgi:AcrR family transcriptional regulator
MQTHFPQTHMTGPETVPHADGCDDDRPRRSDARRNQERVLVAAEELFATRGVDVPVDEIAARAGVGVGTLYRHFPGGKASLVEAVILQRLSAFLDRARELSSSQDPRTALFTIIRELARLVVQKKDLTEELARAGVVPDELAGPVRQELEQLMRDLWERAQREHTVRCDIDFRDATSLITATCLAADRQGHLAVDRLVGVMCDGFMEWATRGQGQPG